MTRKSMNSKKILKSLLCSFFLIQTIFVLAQEPDIVAPGSKSINTELLHTGDFEWSHSGGFSFEGTSNTSSRFVSVSKTSKEITITERITENEKDVIKRKMVFNAQTFEPISSSYLGNDMKYDVKFGSKLTGEEYTYRTGKKYTYNKEIKNRFIDEASIVYLVSMLPLEVGYKAYIPVKSFQTTPASALTSENNIFQIEIDKIAEKKTFSCNSGEVIDLFVVELSHYDFNKTIYIDKKTRRIVRLEDRGDAYHTHYYADKEIHINPIKTKFNVEEAKAMISNGTSTIIGQAYTIDENMPTAMIQRKKKIIAPKGSIVMLVPNTPYVKEWLEFNTHIRKAYPPEYIAGQLYSGCGGYPLPLEVKEQTLLTEVTDNKGSFSFQNLKPGEYHILVHFVATKYTNTTRTPNGSYNVTINPDGSGSATQNVDIVHWGSPTDVTNYKLVKIENEGENVKVKLKD